MVDAVLLDFYGTVVHEDDVLIDQICDRILRSARRPCEPSQIGGYWWTTFSEGFLRSHGESFRTQRDIETESLARTIRHFDSTCDVDELASLLFEHWQRPPLFDAAARFLSSLDLPVVVISNIDRADIDAAIAHHDLTFERVITSEDVRSYKPRPELFLAGLQALGCRPDHVLHVGDSMTSDVAGAQDLGIPVAWVNRKGRSSPALNKPTDEVTDLDELVALVKN